MPARTLERTASAPAREWARLAGALRAFCDDAALGPGLAERALVLFDEHVANLLRHAPGATDTEVRLTLAASPSGLRMAIEDGGPAFDPLGLPPPELDRPPAERPVGGLGVHLIRNVADEAAYERDGGVNRVTLVLRDRPHSSPAQ